MNNPNHQQLPVPGQCWIREKVEVAIPRLVVVGELEDRVLEVRCSVTSREERADEDDLHKSHSASSGQQN